MEEPFDLVVIGGGINGAGTARDAAGRGLRVLLAEKDDLAQGTSSRSGKYIHGGLRYLEYYEFRLVREALIEREVVLNAAPHLAWPMRLLLVHSPEQRPRWLIRLGLFLYDNLGGRKKIPGTRSVNLRSAPEGHVIKKAFRRAFAYYDVWVDDARLVVANAVDARRLGATVLTRTAVTSARREDGLWSVTLQGPNGRRVVRARALFNAAGPWVEQAIGQIAGVNSSKRIRLVKGSHLIMKRWWQGDHGYVLQAPDKRIIFVNPYFDDMALVGTTDIPFDGRAEDVSISEDETRYLLDILNTYFTGDLTEADILSSYSGVRPLFDDDAEKGASAVTRDYTFEMDGADHRAPLLSAFGGKLTTYRKLSEAALEQLAPHFPKMGPAWTERAPLPGGDFPDADFQSWLKTFHETFPWLGADLARHYAGCYGTDAPNLLGGAESVADLGTHFGGLFYAREAEWLMAHEWALTADDMLHRRTKHALFMTEAEQQAVTLWLERVAAA